MLVVGQCLRGRVVATGDCSRVGAKTGAKTGVDRRTRLADATFYGGVVSLAVVMVWFVTLTDPVLAALLRSAVDFLAR